MLQKIILYSSFTPDADNVIPITDEEYLEDYADNDNTKFDKVLIWLEPSLFSFFSWYIPFLLSIPNFSASFNDAHYSDFNKLS